MSAVAIQQMADRIAGLMEERLGIAGSGLAAKLRRRGGMLPSGIRKAARGVAKAAEMAKDPVTLLQVDMARVSADFDACVRYLSTQSRRRSLLRRAGASAVSLALGGAALAAVALWLRP